MVLFILKMTKIRGVKWGENPPFQGKPPISLAKPPHQTSTSEVSQFLKLLQSGTTFTPMTCTTPWFRDDERQGGFTRMMEMMGGEES